MARKRGEHYVNNKDFSLAVMAYATIIGKIKERVMAEMLAEYNLQNTDGLNKQQLKEFTVEFKGIVLEESPIIPSYIGSCFLKMAYKIAKRPNFFGYSYNEEMVMDGVENCIKAIANFDAERAAEKSRKGIPNAFGYFTQIIWFAFLRRIAKEKKQQEIKERFMEEASLGEFADMSSSNGGVILGRARQHNDMLKSRKDNLTPTKPQIIKRTKKVAKGPSGLENFYE